MKYFLIVAVFLSSCNLYQRKGEVYMNDPDFVEFGREYSPDSTMILLDYGIDQGAFGYGRAGKAVLKLSDTTKNLRDFTIQNFLIKIHWLNNDTISAKLDVIPYLRSGKQFKLENQEVNGITVQVDPFDYIEPDYERIIEHREVSPDKKYDLIAYRYSKSRSALNFIHEKISKLTNPEDFVNESYNSLTRDYPFHNPDRHASKFLDHLVYLENGLYDLKYFKKFLALKGKLEWAKEASKSIPKG